jgi:hypothetical protein
MKSMVERVNEIDWSSLEHAYGSAEDVPHLLIDLQSDDSDVRKSAYDELFGNIWHQGTIYSATAYAVPFLFELLDCPATQDKEWLIALLASIASGKGYYQVHQPIFERWNSKADKPEKQLKQEAADVQAVREAISPRFETLLEQITNKESEIRLAVAEATLCYPEHSEKSLLKLREALEVETDEDVMEAIKKSINQLINSN